MQTPFVAGIVAEYNPFHLGHQYMVNQLRAMGAETIVCVISGPFVQRAQPAFFPTVVRAKAALAAGVDLVLRLPLSWAAASAERFAQGGVGLLANLGCVDKIAFGAECADTQKLSAVAQALLCNDFPTALHEELEKGVSFAAARAAAAEKLYPGSSQLLGTPNNILAVEYIKALLNTSNYANTALSRLVAIQRKGAAHDASPSEGFASASWLRHEIALRGMASISAYVPCECMPIYDKAHREGGTIDPARFETALLGRLRGKTAAEFAGYAGAGEGLENRLAEAVKNSIGLEEMYALTKSKRFAHSRVRRFALACALQIDKPKKNNLPPFAQVLAANTRGLALLRQIKHTSAVPVSTSLAKLAKTSTAAKTCVQAETAAEDFYAFCLTKPQKGGTAFTQPAVIVK